MIFSDDFDDIGTSLSLNDGVTRRKCTKTATVPVPVAGTFKTYDIGRKT